MKSRHYLLLITAAVATNLTADTIVLKTGEKYEGKILSQDDTSYFVEIYVTKSITDERHIPKDQVDKIIEEPKDARPFEQVKALVPTPDRLTIEAYTERLKTARDFLSKFPKSAHTKAVQTIIETLENEQQTISKGGIKLGGQLISASDLEANIYDIHARMLLLDMQRYASNGNYQRALRKWETLKNDYSRSTAYKTSLTKVEPILRAYSSRLHNYINTLDAREAKRQTVILSLKEGDRQRTVAYLAEKQKAYESQIEKEEKVMHTRWLTIDPYHKKALEYNLRNAETTLNGLGSQNNSKDELAGPIFRGAWSSLAKGDLKEAAKLIKKLQSMRLPVKYTDPLEKQLEEKQALKAAEDKAAKERTKQEWLDKVKAEEAAEAAKAAEEKKKPGRGRKK